MLAMVVVVVVVHDASSHTVAVAAVVVAAVYAYSLTMPTTHVMLERVTNHLNLMNALTSKIARKPRTLSEE